MSHGSGGEDRLNIEALRFLIHVELDCALRTLASRIDRARTPIALCKGLNEIDTLSVDRMVVAVFGTESTARKLEVDPDLADRMRKANPEPISPSLLILKGDLDLRGLHDTIVPWVCKVDGWIYADRTRRIGMPSLQSAGALFAIDAEDLNIPNLGEMGLSLIVH